MRHTIARLALPSVALLAVLSLSRPLAAQADSAKAMAHDAMGHDAMAMSKSFHGSFTGVGNHQVSGGFEVVTENGKPVLRFTQDFSLSKAPDAYVVLSSTTGVDRRSKYLGRVKTFSGAAAFEIPAGTDLASFSHVVIWCKKFKVALADAPLASGEGMMQHDQMKH
ncbi:MAG: DM13 domain-containing protein [Gemmatimonadales bacterium]